MTIRRLSLLLLLFLGVLPLARAKVAVHDSQFGFSFELPLGFKEAEKSYPGHAAGDIVDAFTHPGFRGQLPIVVLVERLHAPLARNSTTPGTGSLLMIWKGFRLPVERQNGTENGEAMVSYQVHAPLSPEGMRVFVRGPAAQEKKIFAALQMLLATLDAPATWTPNAAERAAAQGKQPGPRPGIYGITKSHPAAAETPAHVPEPEPRRGWLFYAVLCGVGALGIFFLYARFQLLMRLPPVARYLCLIALPFGVMAAAISGPAPLGSPGKIGLLVLGCGVIAFAVWRIKGITSRTNPAPAPVGSESVTEAGPFMMGGVDWTRKSDAQVRGFGLFILFMTALAAYWLIVQPLQKASDEHPDSLMLTRGVILFLPALAASGLFFLALGKKAVFMAEAKKRAGAKMNPLSLAAVIFLLLAGVGVLFWFNAKLRALGYNV